MTPADLRARIAAKGMTQAEAASATHRRPRTIEDWLGGRRPIDPAAVELLRRARPKTAHKPRRGPRNRVKADA